MITYHPKQQQGKVDVLSCHSYLMPKEGDATYNQSVCMVRWTQKSITILQFSLEVKFERFRDKIGRGLM